MADITLDAEALGQLGHEQKALLDTIDSLRNLGVEPESLPQIIVVGDKSSGKSSVLEAISRVRFPVKSGLCTRSPTELVLRKASQQRFAVKVRSKDSDRPLFDEKRFSKDDLPRIIDEAKELMGIGDGARDFSEEVLRIEISGPDLPHLTLVDLPGLYRTETSEESLEGMAIVTRLAERYMQQKNTIILAVITAQSLLSVQAVLGLAKVHDPNRERTMGVITKPDKLESETADEADYFRLAQNQESAHVLKLGWHILRNRDSKQNDENGAGASKISDKDRDDNEKQFLASGIWENIPSQNKGVEALRQKLSTILTQHIQQRLPNLIEDIENKLESRQNRLSRLGESRKSDAERRSYLLNIANHFRDMARAATKGTYDGKFFNNVESETGITNGQLQVDERKLRAVIRNLNCAFDAVLSNRGATRKIKWNNTGLVGDDNEHDIPSSLQPWVDVFRAKEPVEISWDDLKAELEMRAANNQGTQFPGSSNDRLALELFRHQSQRWESIAKKYLDLVLKAARSFVQLALEHIVHANTATRDAIIDEYVDRFFRERADELTLKLKELLLHYQEGDAICLEEEFQRRVARRNTLHLAIRVKNILQPLDQPAPTPAANAETVFQALRNAPEDKVDNFGLERIAEMMVAYYEMSLRTFTDNVIILAVENCLVAKIPDILTSITAYDMDEEKLKRLTDEPQMISRERVRLIKEIEALEEGLRICEKHRPWGIAPFPSVVMKSKAVSREPSRGVSVTPLPVDSVKKRKELNETLLRAESMFVPSSEWFNPMPSHFGSNTTSRESLNGGLFGPTTRPASSTSPNLFGETAGSNQFVGSSFGSPPQTAIHPSGGLSGSAPKPVPSSAGDSTTPNTGLFGSVQMSTASTTGATNQIIFHPLNKSAKW